MSDSLRRRDQKKRSRLSSGDRAEGRDRKRKMSVHDLYTIRYRSLTQMRLEEMSEQERKKLSMKARSALKQIEQRLEEKPSRIARLKPKQHAKATRPVYAPGLLVVKCKEDVVAAVPDIQTAQVASIRTFTLPTAVESPFKDLEKKGLIKEVIPVFSRLTSGRSLSIAPTSVAASFATSVRDSENEDLRGLNVLRLSKSIDLREVEKDLANTPGIEYIHRVPVRWMTATKSQHMPNDPMVGQQWNLRAIRWINIDPLPEASAVKVALLDTGVDIAHPDLENIVQTYIHGGASPTDIVGHGTHVAGILSAETNNNIGIAGTCHCNLSVWKIFNDTPNPSDGEYYVDEIMYQRALNAARNAGMRVVNLSIGGTQHNQTEEMLFRRLIDAGATVVASMGNEFIEGNPTEYPAAYQGVIAVGATGESNRRAEFSNTGAHIRVSAPGVNILSTLPITPSATRNQTETNYAVWSGTSMAAPHVSAVAALIIAINSGLSPQQVAEKIASTAIKLPAMQNKNFSPEYGYGLLNVENALQ